jgi:integrase
MASLPEAVRVTYDKVEALARALATRPCGYERLDTEVEEDHRDAEAVRVSAYSGLRMGELLALRWVDVDFAGSALTISRVISDGVETTTKSGQVRRVPMGDDAAAALERLSQRRDFTYPEDLIFCRSTCRRRVCIVSPVGHSIWSGWLSRPMPASRSGCTRRRGASSTQCGCRTSSVAT